MAVYEGVFYFHELSLKKECLDSINFGVLLISGIEMNILKR